MRAAEEIAKALGKSYDLAAYNSAFHLLARRAAEEIAKALGKDYDLALAYNSASPALMATRAAEETS